MSALSHSANVLITIEVFFESTWLAQLVMISMSARIYFCLFMYASVKRYWPKKTTRIWNLVHTIPWGKSKYCFLYKNWPLAQRNCRVTCIYAYLLDCVVLFSLIFIICCHHFSVVHLDSAPLVAQVHCKLSKI